MAQSHRPGFWLKHLATALILASGLPWASAQSIKSSRPSEEKASTGGICFGEPGLLNVGADDSEEVMQVVRIPIIGSAGENMKKDDLRVTVRFVERTGYDTDVRTGLVGDEATVKYLWQAEPVDWEEGAEDLEVRCKYMGMGEIVGAVATLEYQGKLQDAFLTGRDEDQLGLAQQLSILLANQQCHRLVKLAPFGNTETFVEPLPELQGGRFNWTATKNAGNGDLNVHVTFDPAGHTPVVKVQQPAGGISDTVDTQNQVLPAATQKPGKPQDDGVKPPTVLEE